jgi:hypothetical protein
LALDHYVSEAHLRNFYSPTVGERLRAVRKRDGKAFMAKSEALCRIEEGSTNAYQAINVAVSGDEWIGSSGLSGGSGPTASLRNS